jgi:hypothetical protein
VAAEKKIEDGSGYGVNKQQVTEILKIAKFFSCRDSLVQERRQFLQNILIGSFQLVQQFLTR